jgi:hypothetical protein
MWVKHRLKPGVYGGQDTEGVWEKDTYEPKRYFSMYLDQDLVMVVERRFRVEDFHTVSMGEGAPHFQSCCYEKRMRDGCLILS